MRDNSGGGNSSEGEMIETVEVPITQVRDLVFDENYAKPTGCAFAILWFLKEKRSPSLREVLHNNMYEVGVLASGISLLAMFTALGLHALRG